MVLIYVMPWGDWGDWGGWIRLGISAAWMMLCLREIAVLRRNEDRVVRIRLNNFGAFKVISAQGETEAVDLMPGSIVSARLAWLRLRFADGQIYGELLAGNAVKDREWHRFQLIWHQCKPLILVARVGLDP